MSSDAFPPESLHLVEHPDLEYQWILDRVSQKSYQVRMSVPEGFSSYGRLFYPFNRRADGLFLEPDERPVLKWATVAQSNGRVAHATMEAEMITIRPDPEASWLGIGPDDVCWSPPGAWLVDLAEVLERYTSSPKQTYFGVWTGYGDFSVPAQAHLVYSELRQYVLYQGQITDWIDVPTNALVRPPDLWWPADHAWCFATDTDFRWAYLGAPSSCIMELTQDERLEVFETSATAPARYGMDHRNRGHEGLDV